MKVSERFRLSSNTAVWLREDKMAIILMRQLLFLASTTATICFEPCLLGPHEKHSLNQAAKCPTKPDLLINNLASHL